MSGAACCVVAVAAGAAQGVGALDELAGRVVLALRDAACGVGGFDGAAQQVVFGLGAQARIAGAGGAARLGFVAFGVPAPGVGQAVRVLNSGLLATGAVAVAGDKARGAGLFDELAGCVVFALAELAQRVGAAYPVAARVVAALALHCLGCLAPGQAHQGALGYGAALGVCLVGGDGAVGCGGAGQMPASVAPAAGATQRVGEAGQAAARGVANLAAVAARLAQPGELAFGAVAVAGDEIAWLAVFGEVAGAVVDAGAHAAQRVGFLREVAKGVVLALGGAPQRVGDGGFVVVGVVLVAGDAACGVGDLGDVAACVIAVGGGAAVAALDGLLAFACGAFTMGDLHAVAGRVGLFDEAAGAVVFGFELQSPRRVAVAA